MTKQRDNQFDTIKGIMIFLVVLGHLTQKYTANIRAEDASRYLLFAIYSFHMPVFIFASGYFSKHAEGYAAYAKKAVASCLIPYVIFNCIYAVVRLGPHFSSLFQILSPEWTLWYLLSLFFWKVLVDSLAQFRWPLAVSILLSLFMGFTPAAHYFSVARTFSFFPFFLAGYLCSPEQVEKMRSGKKWAAVILFLVSIGLSLVLADSGINLKVLQYSVSYAKLGLSNGTAVLLRAASLAVGFVCVYALLVLVPKGKNFVSALGKNSLPVYVAHPGVILALIKLGVIEPGAPLAVPFSIGISLLICLAFGNEYIARGFNTLMGWIRTAVLKRTD